MGRLVYVREVGNSSREENSLWKLLTRFPFNQDRETEPRFTGPSTHSDFEGGPRSGMGGGADGGGGRQLYVSNVCSSHCFGMFR